MVMLAILGIGCSDDAKPGFDEDAVIAYLRGLNVTGRRTNSIPALLEDARNICTRPLDDGTIAVIKVSVGQGTGAILRAGCPTVSTRCCRKVELSPRVVTRT
jgi:hypothetical protein